MSYPLLILIVEALIIYFMVLGAHALRHRFSLNHFYALMGGITAIMSLVTDAGLSIEVFGITFLIGSTVFYTGLLLGVFVTYVFDGPGATRDVIAAIIAVSILMPLIAFSLHFHMELTHTELPILVSYPSLRINTASVVVTLIDLYFLTIAWGYISRSSLRIGLPWRVFITLLAVMSLDVVLFNTAAFGGTEDYFSIIQGTFYSRLAITIFGFPILYAYIIWQNTRQGKKIESRPVLAIFQEVIETKHELNLAQTEIRLRKEAEHKTLLEIQARARIEARHRESEDRLRMALTAAKAGTIFWDAKRGMNIWDKRARAIFGLDPDYHEKSYKIWTEVVHPHDLENVNIALQTAIEKRGLMTIEFRTQPTETGEYRYVRAQAMAAYSEETENVMVNGLVFDITEQIQTEAALIAAKRDADNANKIKSDFLANMSHEIRTPINGIIGMTNLALQTDLSYDQREFMESVSSSADSLFELINDILDFSKIEAGKLDFSLVDFDFQDMVGKTLKSLARRAQEKELELVLSIDPAIPKKLNGDPHRIRQIINNLVGNAIKFTKKGEVIVSVDSVGGSDDSISIKFMIRDTGIGIPENKLVAIFEDFAQVDASTTREFGGTGLGLAISSRLVEMMGGEIDVKSKLGVGSEFSFSVELGISDDNTDIHPVFGGTKALIIDNNLAALSVMKTMLMHLGMQVDTLSLGSEVRDSIESSYKKGQPYDYVMLDVHLTDMDGFDVADFLARNSHSVGDCILMLESLNLKDDISKCQKFGFENHIIKPFTESDVFNAIMRAPHTRNIIGFDFDYWQSELSGPAKKERLFKESDQIYSILVAEDNPINQRLITILLEKMGHKVVLTSNGVDTVKKYEEGQFDAILMDIQMPLMDGIEATKSIRLSEADGDGHIPIIALTAHAMSGDRDRFVSAGMDAYLTKPVDINELKSTLIELIGEALA